MIKEYDKELMKKNELENIRIPITSLEMLYAKGLLKIKSGKEIKEIFEDGISHSNDENIFRVKQQNGKIIVDFNLEHTAKTTLKIKELTSPYINTICDNKTFDCGEHQLDFIANRDGIYIVNFVINGRIYTRKIGGR